MVRVEKVERSRSASRSRGRASSEGIVRVEKVLGSGGGEVVVYDATAAGACSDCGSSSGTEEVVTVDDGVRVEKRGGRMYWSVPKRR